MTSQTTEQLRATIAANIRKARDARNYSQRELAQRMELGEMQVSRWERGVGAPSHTNLTKLAAALDVEVGSFYEDAAA